MNDVMYWIFSVNFGLICSLIYVDCFVFLVNNLIIELFEVRLSFFGDD